MSASILSIRRNSLDLLSRLSNQERKNIICLQLCLKHYNIKIYKDIWNSILDFVIPIHSIDAIKFIDNNIDHGMTFMSREQAQQAMMPYSNDNRAISLVARQIKSFIDMVQVYYPVSHTVTFQNFITTDNTTWTVHTMGIVIDVIIGCTIETKSSAKILSVEFYSNGNIYLGTSTKSVDVNIGLTKLLCYTANFPIITYGMYKSLLKFSIKFDRQITEDNFTVHAVGCAFGSNSRIKEIMADHGLGLDVVYKGYYCFDRYEAVKQRIQL